MAPDRASGALRPVPVHQELSMLDILMLGLGLGFFLLTLGYTYACERL